MHFLSNKVGHQLIMFTIRVVFEKFEIKWYHNSTVIIFTEGDDSFLEFK